jgi:hypothetical protein
MRSHAIRLSTILLCFCFLLPASPAQTSRQHEVTRPYVSLEEHVDDYRWSGDYGMRGADAAVFALAAGADGMYAGGEFTVIGSAPAKCIARWDGARWQPVGEGLNYSVHAISFDGTDLYAGGSFTEAGGVPAMHVAKWDGAEWSALGLGINNTVYAISAQNGTVYAGGYFHLADSLPASNIACWDGSQWTDMAGGVNRNVYAIEVDGSDVYVGGRFTTVGGDSISGLAKWDGNTWSAVGDLWDGIVWAIEIVGDDIYVALTVESMFGSIIESWVLKWDGVEWNVAGGAVIDPYGNIEFMPFEGVIRDITFFEGKLYAARFSYDDYDLFQLNETYWYPVGNVDHCCSPGILALDSYDGIMFIGGSFSEAALNSSGNFLAYNILGYNGSLFGLPGQPPGDGFNNGVYDITVDGDDVYVGGSFTHIGGYQVNRIAKWDGTRWNSIGGGVDDRVNAITVKDGQVYVGGIFERYGGQYYVESRGIARWDGSHWHSMGGISRAYYEEVDDIEFWNDEMYIAGRFPTAGGVTVNNIARWDGSGWHSLAGGVTGDRAHIYGLAAGDDGLYVTGNFYEAGGLTVDKIARWDGSAWYPLGSGFGTDLNQRPRTLTFDGDNLYVVGDFDSVGGVPADNIARWNGAVWQAIDNPIFSSVSTSLVIDQDIYFGGYAYEPAENGINLLARWDGSDWYSLGSGLGGKFASARALARCGEDLYVGGAFRIAGNKTSMFFGKWDLDDTVPALIQSFVAVQSAGKVELSWQVIEDEGLVGYRIYRLDVPRGKEIVINKDGLIPRNHSSYVDLDVLPAGVYRYSLGAVHDNGLETRSDYQEVRVNPFQLALFQNNPNPFNPATTIWYSVPKPLHVNLGVYDVQGRLVVTLLDKAKQPGLHRVRWNGTNAQGDQVSSGVYFVRLHSNKQIFTKKMTLLK